MKAFITLRYREEPYDKIECPAEMAQHHVAQLIRELGKARADLADFEITIKLEGQSDD